MNSGIFTITTQLNDINHIATTLWYSGCNIKCGGCHNEQLLNFAPGLPMEQIEQELRERRKLTEWLVYSGGNPIDSIESVLHIAKISKSLNYYQFLFTGYTLEQIRELLNDQQRKQLAHYIDYVKVGMYDCSQKRSCSEQGKDYFFETLNQAVAKSNKENSSWDIIYSFNNKTNSILGSFLI